MEVGVGGALAAGLGEHSNFFEVKIPVECSTQLRALHTQPKRRVCRTVQSFDRPFTQSPSLIHHHLFTITYSPPPIHHHLFTITCSPSPIHHHLFTVAYSPSPILPKFSYSSLAGWRERGRAANDD